AIWYLDNDMVNLWMQLLEETTGRWDEFMEALVNVYPGAGEQEKRYVKADLINLV
ncbi:hypothetical protein M404DRAFT_156543, partial [Pisolithus tinctorius Marx 270]